MNTDEPKPSQKTVTDVKIETLQTLVMLIAILLAWQAIGICFAYRTMLQLGNEIYREALNSGRDNP